MKILFIGGFLRGRELLMRLLDRNESVVGAFVFEEDPHEKMRFAGDIESLCRRHGIPVRRTRKLRKVDAVKIANDFAPDVIFCCGWRTMLPDEILRTAPCGVVAAHDSLLPRLRGFSPTNWALILGNDHVGVTLFRLVTKIDEGDVYFQESIDVTPGDTLASIVERIAHLSASLYERYLDAAREDRLKPTRQQNDCATYACARTPEDGEIVWSTRTIEIVNLVRALAPPAPGAYTYFDQKIMRILKVSAVNAPPNYEGRIPGRIVARARDTIDVLSGDGIVRIEEVERDGVRAAPASIIKSLRAHLGVRVSLEIERLHDEFTMFRERLQKLEKRIETIERKER